jgi:DNA repair protein RAD5
MTVVNMLRHLGRIGVKAIQSNALLAAQKQNGSAVINEKSLKHFEKPSKAERRSASPSKGSTSSADKDKGKGKTSAKNSDNDNDDDEDSGDEAEKLNDEQMNELDTIYRK